MTTDFEIKVERGEHGAGFSRPDLRDYRIAKASLNTEFPEEFELDYMSPVKNQGSVGSCVAHAIATCAEYFNWRQHNLVAELSPGYIYGNRVPPLGTGAGMVTRDAIANFCIDGAPLLLDFPLHCEVPEIIDAVAAQKEELHPRASKSHFSAYLKVSSEREIKTALLDGCPIIIAVDWQKDMKVTNGIIQSEWKESDGGHAMVIYGWDKNGWKVRNSWSIFWGNHGSAIWPYEYKIRELYAIIDTDDTLLDIDKPFAVKTKFGRWCIHVANRIYSVFFSIRYKLKH